MIKKNNIVSDKHISIKEIKSIRTLKGLDEMQLKSLEATGIQTVLDLATSVIFRTATTLLRLSQNPQSDASNIAFLLDPNYTNRPLNDCMQWPVSSIKGVGKVQQEAMEKAGMLTVADLAQFPGYHEATKILGYYRRDEDPDTVFFEPPSAPQSLLPDIVGATDSSARFSHFVTERDIRDALILVDNQCGPISPVSRIFTENRCPLISLGYVSMLRQTWTNVGTSLGEVVHSLALAPGESRNIVTIDWKRTHLSVRDEKTKVTEQVNSVQVHKRALDEVVRTVAEEHQAGSTQTAAANAATAGSFVAAGAVVGGIGGGVAGAVTGLVAGNVANVAGGTPTIAGAGVGAAVGAGAGAIAGSVIGTGAVALGSIESDSSGNREIIGKNQQRITQATQQKSSAIRSLWSSIVLENQEAEQSHVVTTTVTNYNHMHALTVQYYEVMQHYCVTMSLDDIEPLLFLPFKPLSFGLEDIEQFWPILRDAVEDDFLVSRLDEAFGLDGFIVPPVTPFDPDAAISDRITLEIQDRDWNPSFPMEPKIIKKNGNRVALSIINSSIRTLRVNGQNVVQLRYRTYEDIQIADIEKVVVERLAAVVDSRITVRIRTKIKETINGELITAVTPFQSLGTKTIPSFSPGGKPAAEFNWRIADNLNDVFEDFKEMIREQQNALLQITTIVQRQPYFYTKVLLQSLEAGELIDVLSSLKLKINDSEIHLNDLVHVVPVGITANSMVFKMKNAAALVLQGKSDPFRDMKLYAKELATFLARQVNLFKTESEVFLPTSGLFAEAILGRSNSAEILDSSRFTDWADNPIPHTAPLIQPVDADQIRHVDQDVSPTLPPATINLVNPVSFPDPSLGKALDAIQNGNIFRDMSKSDQLVSVLGDLTQLSGRLGEASSKLTGDAATEALKSATQTAALVESLSKALLNSIPQDLKSASAKPPATASEKGAAANFFKDLIKSGNAPVSERELLEAAARALGVPLSGDPLANPVTFAGTSGDFFPPSPGLGGFSPDGFSINDFLAGGDVREGLIFPDQSNRVDKILLSNFDINQSDLTEDHKMALDLLAKIMDNDLDIRILAFEGRASSTGDDENNITLSHNRAKTVKDYLSVKGVSDERLGLVNGYGSALSLSNTPNQENRIDRSVVISYQWKLAAVSEPQPSVDPSASRFWAISLSFSAGGGFVIGGSVFIGTLRNLTTNKIRAIYIFVGGLDGALGVPFNATGSADSTGEVSFTTRQPLTFESFDATLVSVFGYQVGIFAGVTQTRIRFPMIDSDEPGKTVTVDIPGVGIGQIQSASAIAQLGVLNVQDK